MTKPGKPDGWKPQSEEDHFMRCPVCHEWFDMRDLCQAFAVLGSKLTNAILVDLSDLSDLFGLSDIMGGIVGATQ